MRHLLYITFLFLICNVQAQHTSCGDFHDINASFIRQHLATPAASPRTDQYIPLAFRLVGDDAGQGLALTSDIYEAVCQANTYFAGSGMQFYVHRIDNPFNGDFFRDEPLGNPELFDLIRDTLAVNIYVTRFSQPVLFSGYGSSTAIQEDIILMDNSVLRGDRYPLAHQLGHFFRLLHPFSGWFGLNPSDIPTYFDPNGLEPAVDTLPNGIPTELADGSNCEITGDRICDTPPDFLFGAVFDNCPQQVRILDANGDSIPWTPGNIMGSFLDCELDSYYFSPLQQQVMFTDYQSPERAYLRQLPQPIPVDIIGEPTLLEPMEEEEVCGENFVWESTAEAPAYLVEISRLPNFSFEVLEYVTDIPNLQLPPGTLAPDRTYYWRVTPLNFGITCGTTSARGSFNTIYCDVSTASVSGNDDWQVFPNPLGEGQSLQVSSIQSFSGEVELTLFNVQGERILSQKRNFRSSLSVFTIPNPDLPAGLYFLQLQDGKNSRIKPVIID